MVILGCVLSRAFFICIDVLPQQRPMLHDLPCPATRFLLCFKEKVRQGGHLYDNRTSIHIAFCLLCDPMGNDVQQKKKQQLTEIMSLFLSWMQDLADESRHQRMMKLLVHSKIKIHNGIMTCWQAYM